jgi:putative ABC transport system ATP-binding protein
MKLLLSVVRSEGITALVATHDEALIDLADAVIVLEDGCVVTGPAPGQQVLAGEAGTQTRDRNPGQR